MAGTGGDYEIESVARACRVIKVLRDQGSHSLSQLADAVGLSRPTVFRLLSTLRSNGLISRDSQRQYRLIDSVLSGRKFRIGYLAETGSTSFYKAVTTGLLDSAKQSGIDLIVMDCLESPEIALRNAEKLLSENVDLVIQFLSYSHVASMIASLTRERRVPLIAIEMPTPDAIYFGVDNCQAGLTAGRYLARWAERNWKGKVDEIVLVGAQNAGYLPEARLTGSLLGIHEVLPNATAARVIQLDGKWSQEASRDAMERHLRRSTAKRILVSAIFDPSAVGALDAFKSLQRQHECAVVGQNGTVEARTVLRNPKSRLIGTVGYFPELYGERLINLALGVLGHLAPVPKAVFVKHQFLTASNLVQFYSRGMCQGEN
jgi:ribose transport system substrate-binding protein